MSIQPVNIGSVTDAIRDMLLQHPEIGNVGVTVERSAEPPEDPGPEGYIGIYKGRVSFPPRVIGRGPGYRDQTIRLALSIRMSGYEDGDECETALENLLQNVVSCLLSDTSLRGTVDNIGEVFEIQYDTQVVIKDKDEEYLQIANLFFDALTTVNITED